MAEIVDKATILRLKTERIADKAKAECARKELETLIVPQVGPFEDVLYAINGVLWNTEDRLRELEHVEDFGSEFVLLARSVYFVNDLRAQTKSRISKILGQEVKEVKSYTK